MIVCLRRRDEAPAGWAEGAAEVLLAVAPRVAVDADDSVWLDARGLDAAVVARSACERLEIPVGCGVSAVPVAAWASRSLPSICGGIAARCTGVGSS